MDASSIYLFFILPSHFENLCPLKIYALASREDTEADKTWLLAQETLNVVGKKQEI